MGLKRSFVRPFFSRIPFFKPPFLKTRVLLSPCKHIFSSGINSRLQSMISFPFRNFPALVLLLSALLSCRDAAKNLRFELLDSAQTGLTFRNDITESDSLNIFHDEFIYNGGGVGVGDFNGDGLQDLYFTGNQVENRLYLNRGGLKYYPKKRRPKTQRRMVVGD
jgi:hypothetical protein